MPNTKNAELHAFCLRTPVGSVGVVSLPLQVETANAATACSLLSAN